MLKAKNGFELVKLIKDLNYALLGHAEREEVALMIGTSSVESHNVHREQLSGGPARGLFGVEPDTCLDIYSTYLSRTVKRSLYLRMMDMVFNLRSCPFFIPSREDVTRLLREWDDYSFCISRLKYLRIPYAIPKTHTLRASYYKQWYNTEAGSGSPEKYLEAWNECNCHELMKSVGFSVNDPLRELR